MPKQKLSRVLNTLETLADIPKRATKDVIETFNPLATKSKEHKPDAKNHTPLNVEKVKGAHELKELDNVKKTETDIKMQALRKQLFEKGKAEEMHVIRQSQQKEEEKKEIELSDEQRKQQQIQQKLAAMQQNDMPQGKEQRGGLFAKKKRVKQAVTEQQVEQRASGKH